MKLGLPADPMDLIILTKNNLNKNSTFYLMSLDDLGELFEEWRGDNKSIIRTCMIINQELSRRNPRYSELLRYLEFVIREAKVLRKEIKKSKKLLV